LVCTNTLVQYLSIHGRGVLNGEGELMSQTFAQTTDQIADKTENTYYSAAFWEFLWRSAGIQSVGLFVLAFLIYGYQPGIGAPADALVSFYDGGSTRILISAIFSGLAKMVGELGEPNEN
jgi:hypothetical protein